MRLSSGSAMEVTTPYPYFLMFTVIVDLVDRTSCHVMANLHFEQRTVSRRVNFLAGTRTRRLFNFSDAEERQKLCLYAQLKVDLSYLDHNDLPEWYKIKFDPQLDPFEFGLTCASLPTVYVLQGAFTSNLLIAFVQSEAINFAIDPRISTVNTVSVGGEMERGHPFSHLRSEDYRHLCHRVREHVRLYFLDRKMAGPRKYEFSRIDGIFEIATAVPCPTLPPLYLCLRKSEAIEVNLILLRSFIDDYEFEIENDKLISVSAGGNTLESRLLALSSEERLNLCTIARKYHYPATLVLFVDDQNVAKAQTYEFQYLGGRVEEDTAILCPALPNVYLRVDDKPGKAKIKLNLFDTWADRFTYNVEIIGYVYLTSPNGSKRKQWDEKSLTQHPFNLMTREQHWSLCIGAQKYILSDRRVIFTFATKDLVFKDHQLILGSKYMRSPTLEDFLYRNNRTLEADVLIQCSDWPQVYIRIGKSEDSEMKINILLLEHYMVK